VAACGAEDALYPRRDYQARVDVTGRERVRRMSGPIEDDDWDTLDVEEFPEVQEPDWSDCPILHRAEMFEEIKRRGALDGRSLNLFSALTRPRRSGLVDHYVYQNLYRPGSHYMYVTPDAEQYRYGYWRPVMTKAVAEHRTMLPCTLFSNTLSWGDTRPRERTFNAGFAVYTIEFDHVPLPEQLRIVWSGRLKRISHEFEQFRTTEAMRPSTPETKTCTFTLRTIFGI
jgi:hypothetical protein